HHLHIAWFDRKGVWMATAVLPPVIDVHTLENAFKSAHSELVAPDAALGDIATDAQGRPVLAYSSREGIFVVEGRNSARQIVAAGMEPVIEFDSQGRLHVAYRLQREMPFSGKPVINTQIAYAPGSGGMRPPQVVA